MKTWDAIVVGGGIIGLALARELNRQGASVVVVERGQCGREATYAAAGMLAYGDPESNAALQKLKMASAELYPEWVRELEAESGASVDFRSEGTISFVPDGESPCCPARAVTEPEFCSLEPAASYVAMAGGRSGRVVFTPEQTVDNRALAGALLAAAKRRQIDVSSGLKAIDIIQENGRAGGLRTERTEFHAPVVVNCAGAWSGEIGPLRLPIGPKKGHSLAVVSTNHQFLRHAVRGHDVYLVPRSDGRITIGATVEDAGFDKRVNTETIQRLHQSAANLIPEIGQLLIHEAWAGLRPAASDGLPVMGATSLPGYFVASGHFRNGILLAPITARVMAQVIRGAQPACDISGFSPMRFTG